MFRVENFFFLFFMTLHKKTFIWLLKKISFDRRDCKWFREESLSQYIITKERNDRKKLNTFSLSGEFK